MNLKALLKNANDELETERFQAMSEEERKLHSMAQRLLLLERDLKTPGVTRSTEDRVERILDAIAKESF